MNVYVLVEGSSEKIVYTNWIPIANPNLTYVEFPSMLDHNNFSIISGGGYPRYLQGIEASVRDVLSNSNIDRLVVAIDSEDMTRQDKFDEVEGVIQAVGPNIDYRIIVQHFCLEAWALGNSRVFRTLPVSDRLREFKEIYDVRTNDPEGLPVPPKHDWNRAQFAEVYLRAIFLERYNRFTYSKRNPGALAEPHYFTRLTERLNQTGHIDSFSEFQLAFV